MISKTCNRCGVEKPLDGYGVNKWLKSGIQNTCKECLSISSKTIRKTNEYREKQRNYKKKPEYQKKRRESYKNLQITNPQKYNEILHSAKERAQKRRDSYIENPNLKIKDWQTKNEWDKKKMQDDSNYRTYTNFRSCFKNRVKNKSKKTFDYLDYTIQDFIDKVGPSIKGYHLDHKIPVTWFESFEPHLIYDLDNLHWIIKEENLKKLNFWAHPIPVTYFNKIKDKLKVKYQNRFTIIHDCAIDLFS